MFTCSSKVFEGISFHLEEKKIEKNCVILGDTIGTGEHPELHPDQICNYVKVKLCNIQFETIYLSS